MLLGKGGKNPIFMANAALRYTGVGVINAMNYDYLQFFSCFLCRSRFSFSLIRAMNICSLSLAECGAAATEADDICTLLLWQIPHQRYAWESVADTVSFSSVINSYLDNDLVSAIIESNAECSGRSVTLALDAIFCLSFFFRRNFIFLCFLSRLNKPNFPITRFLISVCHRCTFVHFQQSPNGVIYHRTDTERW